MDNLKLLGEATRLRFWRDQGYEIGIVYLRVPDVRISLQRVAARVKNGRHDVPEEDVRRRFPRSWQNFLSVYRPLANETWTYDVSGRTPVLLTIPS